MRSMDEHPPRETRRLPPHTQRGGYHNLGVNGMSQESGPVTTASKGFPGPDVAGSASAAASVLNSSSRKSIGTALSAAQAHPPAVSERPMASHAIGDEAATSRRTDRHSGRIKSCTQCRQQKVNSCIFLLSRTS
jgi:hypothetical protein